MSAPALCIRCKTVPAAAKPCCSSHSAPLCHGCYRRVHFVEVCVEGCTDCAREGLEVGESTSAALRRVTAELATARTELEQRGQAITEADARIRDLTAEVGRLGLSLIKSGQATGAAMAAAGQAERQLGNALRDLAAAERRLEALGRERDYLRRQKRDLETRLCQERIDADVARDELASAARSGWIVARDGGRACLDCGREIRRGEAYALVPGEGLDALRHVHCRDEEKSMTGPEHYQEAERLLDLASTTIPEDVPAQAAVTARAQVHATLALAAATALAAFDGSGMHADDFRAWDQTCGVNPGPADV